MSLQVKSLTTRRSHVADWERTQKPRVWKGQLRLVIIALLALMSYISLPATIYFTIRLLLEPESGWQMLAALSLVLFGDSFIIGLLTSAVTKCSLCHGSPFLGNRCRKHVLANKLPFLTYRASAILHLICTGKFRCMFCSTPFRLGTKAENASPQRDR